MYFLFFLNFCVNVITQKKKRENLTKLLRDNYLVAMHCLKVLRICFCEDKGLIIQDKNILKDYLDMV